MPLDIDSETLAAVFASRVALAKKTEDEAVKELKAEYAKTVTWIAGASKAPYSFLWYCDFFDLDHGAVRRAIKERRK